MTYDVAATWVALGLEPEKVIFYRQSRVPQVFELFWMLSCLAPKGLMNRAHAYKALVTENQNKAHTDPDSGVFMGLYNYPVLMAADILLFQTHQVPVGRDQLQHIEIARDLAVKFNQTYGDTFVVPEAVLQDKDALPLNGLDGRKMSKSYGNIIPLFAPADTLRSLVFKIKTNSLPPDAPKDPSTCTLFHIYASFAAPEDVVYVRERYATGIGWGEMKEMVWGILEKTIAPHRATYADLMAHPFMLDQLLEEGERRARALAEQTLSLVRAKVGVG
jgi:tryptophanyl-tRNA synthetase